MTRDILPTGDRVYAAVKRQLLSGEIRPGERLDAARMAARHAASITPVRAALHRLVGEGLVVAEAGEGFHAPLVSEASLRDLYGWNSRCLQQACQMAASRGSAETIDPGGDLFDLGDAIDLAAQTNRVFGALGRRSGNAQCAATIEALNDRLYTARLLERRLFADAPEECWAIAAALTGRSRILCQMIARYHRRRIRAAPALVRLIQRGTPPS